MVSIHRWAGYHQLVALKPQPGATRPHDRFLVGISSIFKCSVYLNNKPFE